MPPPEALYGLTFPYESLRQTWPGKQILFSEVIQFRVHTKGVMQQHPFSEEQGLLEIYLVAQAIRNVIRANRFARIIRNYFFGPCPHPDPPNLAFFEKARVFFPKKARVFLFAEPLKSLEKEGKTQEKARKIGKQKKQGNRKKQGLEGQGSTAGTFRKKFRKNSGKIPETLSERFLEFRSRVRLGYPKPYTWRPLRLPEHSRMLSPWVRLGTPLFSE